MNQEDDIVNFYKEELEAIRNELSPKSFTVIRSHNYIVVCGWREDNAGLPRKRTKDGGMVHATWQDATRFTKEDAEKAVAFYTKRGYDAKVMNIKDYLRQLEKETQHMVDILS